MTLDFWRDVSVVWLSLLCLIGLVIPLAVLYFAVRGLNRAHYATIALLRRGQRYSHSARLQSEELSERISGPLIHLNRQATRLRTALQQLLGGRL
jgi:hypothetical protein